MSTFTRADALKIPAVAKALGVQAKAAEKARKPRGMNRWEKRYADRLRTLVACGEVAWWGYEMWTAKLASDCRYTPDFMVVYPGGQIWFVEVKGFKRDDAIVKFKVAVQQNPWASFVMVEWHGGAWRELYCFPASLHPPAPSAAPTEEGVR